MGHLPLQYRPTGLSYDIPPNPGVWVHAAQSVLLRRAVSRHPVQHQAH